VDAEVDVESMADADVDAESMVDASYKLEMQTLET
jgi:hypothetical protein